MPYHTFHYHWQWNLEASPEALWPFVADTNRFNRETGIPGLHDAAPAGANARRTLSFTRFGMRVEYEEEPFQWVRPYRFGVVRRFHRGPVAEMRVLVDLERQPAGGTNLSYQVWARPAYALGLIAIPIQIGWMSRRAFGAAFLRYDRLAKRHPTQPMITTILQELPEPAPLPPGGEARLATIQQTLATMGADPTLTAKLIDLVCRGDDVTLQRVRPYALADAWGVSRRTVLELCLLATRAGLLNFQWDLLCPMCRNSTQSRASLTDVRAQVHCSSCNIDFEVNFDHAVELTFRPVPAVREISTETFCIGGPQITPHIGVQQLLAPHTQRTVHARLDAGRYRWRAHSLRGGQYLRAQAGGPATLTLHAAGDEWSHDEAYFAPEVDLTLDNATDAEQLLILEHMIWNDQAATGADVFALQVFRDLFAEEALRPGDQIEVGSLAVVFTDLRRSTELYRDIGDAAAFGRVMDHFDVLREAIAHEGGAVVKTIGDAVMAVFRRPAGAVASLLAAQSQLATRPDPLRLKVGIHYGPCIAVTLNNRLDYFGSTINAAARMESLSSGSDLILSDAVYRDPEVAAFLAEVDAGIEIEPIQATLKGFESQAFALWRVQQPTLIGEAVEA